MLREKSLPLFVEKRAFLAAAPLKFPMQIPLFVAEVFEDPKTLAAGGFDAVIVA